MNKNTSQPDFRIHWSLERSSRKKIQLRIIFFSHSEWAFSLLFVVKWSKVKWKKEEFCQRKFKKKEIFVKVVSDTFQLSLFKWVLLRKLLSKIELSENCWWKLHEKLFTHENLHTISIANWAFNWMENFSRFSIARSFRFCRSQVKNYKRENSNFRPFLVEIMAFH